MKSFLAMLLMLTAVTATDTLALDGRLTGAAFEDAKYESFKLRKSVKRMAMRIEVRANW